MHPTVEEKQYWVYILASQRNGTLYVGMTSMLVQRVWQHKSKLVEGFSARYCVDKLVYFEAHQTPYTAITREKQLKKWHRSWKLRRCRRITWPKIALRFGLDSRGPEGANRTRSQALRRGFATEDRAKMARSWVRDWSGYSATAP